MSFSSESNNNESYLTDEILQEAIEFEQELEQQQHTTSQHNRLLEEEAALLLCATDDEHDNDNYFNVGIHRPLGADNNYEDHNHLLRDNDCPRYLLPSIDEDSIPTTGSQERGVDMNQNLCWGLDPSQSLSDWELHIFNRSTKSFEIYYVHRVALALGPRGCEFFQDIFRQADGEASSSAPVNKTTRVPLIAESCKLVGCFLDYVYGNNHFQITSENALGMCYLADYFRNHSLWEMATDFIEDDLGKKSGREHLCQYYMDSIYYDQDEFLDHILSCCSRDLLSMLEDGISCSQLLGELTPSHFLRIVVDMEPPTEEKLSSSILLTRLITEFCCMHRNELTMETFDNFTSRIVLLDSSSAVTLLEHSLEYDFGAYDENAKNTSQDSLASLILFQQQCVETLSEEWEEVLELDQSRVTRIMRILALREAHQGILVDWFQKTMKRASSHLRNSRQETERAQQQNLLMEDRCKEMAKKVEIAEDETAASQRNHDTTKSEMKTQISSWMRKNEGTNHQRMAEQREWEHERLRWQMECQHLKHERSKLKRELKNLRRKSASHHNRDYSDEHSKYSNEDRYRGTASPGRGRGPYLIPNDSVSTEGDSYVSDSSSEGNSMLEVSQGFGRRESYPLTNGMSPQFRIL